MKEDVAPTIRISEKTSRIFYHPATAWVILVISLCLTFVAWRVFNEFSQQIAQDRFDLHTQEVVYAIEERMNVYEQTLKGGVALFNSTDQEVSREQWHNYVTSLNIDSNWTGVQGIGYAVPISASQKDLFVQKIRAEGLPDFDIKPSAPRAEYSAIIYLEPFNWRNQRAFGYDMWSNDTRRQAMQRARDTGLPATSGIITLVQETQEDIQKGFLTYLPVYQKNMPLNSVEERQKAFKGWVYAPFRADNLMYDILSSTNHSYHLEIYDGQEMNTEALLFKSDTAHRTSGDNYQSSFSKKIALEIQGRQWLVHVHARYMPATFKESLLPQLVALAGIIIDLLLFYVILAFANLKKRATKIANQMNQAVIQERQLLRTIIDNIPINIYLKDKDSRKILANKAEYEYMGGKREADIIGKNDHDVYLTESSDISREEDLQVLTGQSIINKETTNYRKDGVIRHFLVSKYPLFNSEQQVESILGISIDITEQKNAEKELLGIKELLQQTSELSKVGGWEVNMITQEVYWSDVTKKIHEVPEDYQPDLNNAINFYKEGYHRDTITALVNEAIVSGNPWDIELIIITITGNERWIRAIGKAQLNEDGSCIRIYGTFQDIHDQKIIQLAFNNNKKRLELATQAAGVGIWDYDLISHELIWDDQMLILYGKTRDVFSNIYDAWLATLHPEDSKRIHQEIQLAIAGIKDFDTEFKIIWPNGNTRNIRAIAFVQRDFSGKATHLIGTNWDITEEKELENTLISARKHAEEASKAKSGFLANMSHEIRTPLNSIIGFSDLLMKTPMNDTQRLYMGSVNQSGVLLLDLINDILDFSKIEAGKLDLSIEKTNLRVLIRQVIEIVQYKTQEKGLKMVQEIAVDVPDFAWIDPIRIKQVLVNLLGNAIKFTERGQITLAIHVSDTNEDSTLQHLTFSVKDTGIGIPSNKQKRIFEAFSQADYSTTRKYGGTGLGLSISNQLLILMHSHMQLSSKEGQGSIFFFTIPVKTASSQVNTPNIVAVENTEQRHGYITCPKILVADDNAVNLLLAKSIINHLIPDAIVIEANHGQEAIDLFFQEQPCLVFMDIQMPIMNGYDATIQIRNRENTDQTQVPIIALTAGATKKDEKTSFDTGMNDYISKPITAQKIKPLLQKWLSITLSTDTYKATPNQSHSQLLHFNQKKLLEYLGDDHEILEDMLKLIMQGALDQLVKELENAILLNNQADIKIAIHSLKGTASSLCLDILSNQIATIEKQLEAKQADFILFLEEVQSEVSLIFNEVKSIRNLS